ncbi:TraB/GumN family protein [Biformimicrobium ophioploci]|uniref:TraB/GumN family protein n=1 Tax=Biformimicrobium ophioploci TaxID=3036711 RepID=A0ABQ6M280_9GAMM|nr:TraB/GumN family protein [Microbulbifer sp. NKW57]GMG88433.1 TraB/GumN family protein [Microbulbifer sp. NKW57]
MKNYRKPAWFQQLLTFSLLFALANFAQAANDKALFWEASRGEEKLYVLGSIHVANEDFYPLRADIEKGFAEADALVVEADTVEFSQNMEAQKKVAAMSLYPVGTNLKTELSASTYKMFADWAASRGVPEAMLAQQKPAIAMLSISMLEFQRMGLSAQHGIDLHFLQAAYGKNGKILELEGVLPQLEILNNLPQQDLLLRKTLQEVDEMETMLPKMTSLWKSGDAAGLYNMFIGEPLKEQPEMTKLYEMLFFERNRNMAGRIDNLSKEHGKLFVVVGAGHLVGPGSVIEELEKRGFQLARK